MKTPQRSAATSCGASDALVYRRDTASIVFEAFEASPLSKDILTAQDALSWEFPDHAAQMPADTFFSDSFQETLATFLDNASSEHLPHLADKAHKAGQEITEVRNAGSPALITQMLLSLVQGIGGPAAVQTLRKRTVSTTACIPR
ncbi:hypothetical protein SCUCBS95973_007426 [Sporothrix curviconia]|uniref:DUF6606 domain-containing protein n=1 Tax=Sporothrix curviconia TaxID=1260050 RepID=A0ABP0CD73_9PEZI